MNSILDDLIIKHEEGSHYIKLLKFINNTNHLALSDKNEFLEVNIELKNTLKGLTYLLFYNIIESTLRESIIRIYDSIKENKVCFNSLKTEIKKYIIDQVKNNISSENFVKIINDISLDICYKSIDNKKIFSGNIDRALINNTAKIYGFSTDSNYDETKHGEYLNVIKEHRNDLAHGNLFFSEIGRYVTTQDLEDIHKYLLNYLKNILTNIQTYLDNNLYLEKNN